MESALSSDAFPVRLEDLTMSEIYSHCIALLAIEDVLVRQHAQAILDLNRAREELLLSLNQEIKRLSKALKKERAAVKVLRSSNSNLRGQLKRREKKIEKLKAKLEMAQKQAFGPSADRLKCLGAPTEEDEAKILLQAEANIPADEPSDGEASNKHSNSNTEPAEGGKEKKKKRRTSAGRKKRKFNERIETKTIKHGSDSCECGCGGSIRDYVRVEEWVTVPAQHMRLVHKFPIYRCQLDDGALKPFKRKRRLFPGWKSGASAVAYFVALKFDWFMPGYRQERIMKQEGVFIHRSTISRNINALSERVLSHIADEIYDDLMENSEVLHTDETTHYLLVNGHGKVKKRSLISIVRDEAGHGGLRFPAAYYRVFASASHAAFEKLFADRNLIITHDGHACFNRFGDPGTCLEGIVSTGCWSHARRYFVDAYNISKSAKAKAIVDLIDRLFELERRMWGSDPTVRKRDREGESQPVLAIIHSNLNSILPEFPADGYMGRAIRYVLRRWKQLTRFVDDGRIAMHNNSVERAFKSPTLLRNAALFSASAQGERAWAVCFTLSETCRMNGVNFYRYLLWVMEEAARLGDGVDYRVLLPWNAPDECRTAVDTDGS